MHLFKGSQRGRYVYHPPGDCTSGWTECFYPDGYNNRTWAQLSSQAFLLELRNEPYSKLAELLLGDIYGSHGRYESHVTVRFSPLLSSGVEEEIERFKETCEALSCKPILIELDAGQVPQQLMTGRWHLGPFGEVQRQVYELGRGLVKAGFHVLRTKIEASPSSVNIPAFDEEALSNFPATNYFEFHVRLQLKQFDTEAIERLRRLAKSRLNGHLSRSAFKRLSPEIEQRFVTLRMYNTGRDSAYRSLESALEILRQEGYDIDGAQREYAVMDSNVSLDAGWIEPFSLPSSCSAALSHSTRPSLHSFSPPQLTA